MTLPIKTLKVNERWDCTGCGLCCRGNIVPLDEKDLNKLRGQGWDKHPEFKGIRTVVRQKASGKSHRLAQREDGSCVFLMPDGLCAIHKEYGLSEKPMVCQTYPLQLIPLDNRAVLTLRRSCPTAASDKGKPLDEYKTSARELGTRRGMLETSSAPPKITLRYHGSWREVHQVTNAVSKLLQDDRFPLVRRLVHTLQFCDLLDDCRPLRLAPDQRSELIGILEESSTSGAGQYFQDRQPPNRSAAVLFRQALADYLRLHSKFQAKETWGQRWRLFRMAVTMARGKGTTPQINPDFPVGRFESLETPMGHLAEEVQRPLNRYYEVNGASGQYTFASKPQWTIVESCRALTLTYPIALWMLRLSCLDRNPTVNDATEMVTTIDRGQGYGPLLGRHHRRRVATLARLKQLPQIVAWYAR